MEELHTFVMKTLKGVQDLETKRHTIPASKKDIVCMDIGICMGKDGWPYYYVSELQIALTDLWETE